MGKTKNLIEEGRKLVFPDMTLCLIEFDDGDEINSFIPDVILANKEVSSADWWNNKNKDTWIPLIEGKSKAVKVTPIKEQ
jgi:hypothetical protein